MRSELLRILNNISFLEVPETRSKVVCCWLDSSCLSGKGGWHQGSDLIRPNRFDEGSLAVSRRKSVIIRARPSLVGVH